MDLDTFRYYTGWHDHVNREQYEAPADPWKLLSVDPSAVDYCAPGIGLWGLGRVSGGEWDREANYWELEEFPLYEGLVQRFERGYDWEETALYEWASSRFEDGAQARGYDDLESFRAERCAYVDDLYERIREEGYRPNVEAEHDNPAATDNPYEDAYAQHLEPMVAIGRSGEILWSEGFHRLAIAAILGIETIPVYVVCRHVEWQRTRDEFAATPESESSAKLDAHRTHPDLADLAGETA